MRRVTIRDLPIRDKGVDLIVRRRRWRERQSSRYFFDTHNLKAEGTRYSKEFAAFLKECMETIPTTSRSFDRYGGAHTY